MMKNQKFVSVLDTDVYVLFHPITEEDTTRKYVGSYGIRFNIYRHEAEVLATPANNAEDAAEHAAWQQHLEKNGPLLTSSEGHRAIDQLRSWLHDSGAQDGLCDAMTNPEYLQYAANMAAEELANNVSLLWSDFFDGRRCAIDRTDKSGCRRAYEVDMDDNIRQYLSDVFRKELFYEDEFYRGTATLWGLVSPRVDRPPRKRVVIAIEGRKDSPAMWGVSISDSLTEIRKYGKLTCQDWFPCTDIPEQAKPWWHARCQPRWLVNDLPTDPEEISRGKVEGLGSLARELGDLQYKISQMTRAEKSVVYQWLTHQAVVLAEFGWGRYPTWLYLATEIKEVTYPGPDWEAWSTHS